MAVTPIVRRIIVNTIATAGSPIGGIEPPTGYRYLQLNRSLLTLNGKRLMLANG